MTPRFAVIGDPVAHSASPRMHGAAYAALGLDCAYEAVRTTEDELPEVLRRLRAGELAGLNVTVPHKRRVLLYVDVVDGSAGGVGAANTLVRMPDGRIVAHNTDVPAMALELRELTPTSRSSGWKDAHALVLGTGATARAAVVVLGRDLGVAEITVRGRALGGSAARDALGGELGLLLGPAAPDVRLRLQPWGPSAATEREVDAVIQATSLGMPGGDPGEPAASTVAWDALPRGAIALDVVYAHGATPFVAAASAHGLGVTDGRGMLARQGALAFELWLARSAPLDVMRASLAA